MLHHSPDPGVDCRATDSRRWWQALSAPELRVVICCDEIEIFQFQRTWPGGHMVLLKHQRYLLSGNEHEALPPEAMWQKLHEILLPFAGQRWHVVLVLSNQYARWLVLPWQAEVHRQADKEIYYRHGLQQLFGGEMDDWQIRSFVSGYGQHTLVNALPLSLIESLHSIFAEHRLPIGVIVSAWMLSANQTLQMLRQQKLPMSGWVICRESSSLTIACLVQGEWQSIRYVPVDAEWRVILHQLLLREQVVHPERSVLPIYLPKMQACEINLESMSPFNVVEVPSNYKHGEPFHQPFRRRLTDV